MALIRTVVHLSESHSAAALALYTFTNKDGAARFVAKAVTRTPHAQPNPRPRDVKPTSSGKEGTR